MAGEDIQAQLNYELAVYREQITMLRRETERVSLTTIDLANALRTVEAFKEELALIPIGGGALVKAHINDLNVLLPIGAGYLVNMKREYAIIELTRRIDSTKKAVEKLTEEFNKINSKFREVSGQLEMVDAQSRISQRVDDNTREDYL